MRIRINEKTALENLPISGKDSKGNLYEVNNKYLMKNEEPMLPIMGEFHFSRWNPAEWEEAILKMRAGGVDIVATYIFWNHHEEIKGEWDFSGCRDIKAFLELCKKVNMPVWLRIGPWAHGECRNGGFPDWLVNELGDNGLGAKPGQEKVREARTNDELYMKYVRIFWEKLSEQVKGQMCKDGGAVLGIQLENEYCHAGGPSDKNKGMEHMKTLKQLALELGFEVPYYTTTGWGGAIVIDGETIPVLGGYVDAPWAGHDHEMPACENFLFTPFREDENIGTDLKIEKEEGYTFSKTRNPYLTAELGGGLQVTALRRTYPFPQDIEAQAICMLGAGANLLGYYMYHGGVNPDGKCTGLQEARVTGYFNDLPVKSYDFQTCIRESGKLHESYHRLKKLHMMIHAFEAQLAQAQAYFPDVQPESAEDMITPRISVRYHHDTQEGFLFINNHQRLRKMNPIKGLQVEIEGIGEETFVLENICCESGECAIIPFGLKMGESRLLRTNASLLTKMGERYFFYNNSGDNGEKPYFDYEGEAYDNVVILSKEEAEHTYQLGNRLYITDKALFEQNGVVYTLVGEEEEKVRFYEETGEAVELYLLLPEVMTNVSVSYKECGGQEKKSAIEAANQVHEEDRKLGADENCKVYAINLELHKVEASESDAEETDETDVEFYEDELHEIYLHIDYAGDKAELYADGKLLTDWFSNGEEWIVALKRYNYPQNLKLVVYPYKDGVYYDLPPKKGCEMLSLAARAEYKLEV